MNSCPLLLTYAQNFLELSLQLSLTVFSMYDLLALMILYCTSICRRLTLPNQFLKLCVRAKSVCENIVHNSSERTALSNTRSSLPRYESEMSIFHFADEPVLMSFTHLPFAGTRKKTNNSGGKFSHNVCFASLSMMQFISVILS